MRSGLFRGVFWGQLLLAAFAPVAQAAEKLPALPQEISKFLTRHCVGCHGPDVQERGLRLDKLSPDFADSEAAQPWEKVFDKLARGEMPPKNQPRPPAGAQRSVTELLRRMLHEASLARQKTEGRVLLRRLNRSEHENTLRDLLATTVDVKPMLPEDKEAGGFDKVSAVLETSSEHLLRYQEAAETAILSVLPSGPPMPIKDRRTGLEITQKQQFFNELVGKIARVEGETLFMFAPPYDYIPCATAPNQQAGRYRVRISAYAVNTDGKPIPVNFVCRDQYGRSDVDVRLVRDVPPDKPTTLEGEFDLKRREMIVFAGWSLPTMRQFVEGHKGVNLEKFKGPALAVEWVEIEGPLDPSPEVGFERLFGDGKGKTRSDAEPLINDFVVRAFRRPVDAKIQQHYVDVAGHWLQKGFPYQEALTIAYKAILSSPRFLMLSERPGKLDDYAVASRLSYFLWNSLPDEELLSLAAQGKLTKPETLKAQVERMLKAPHASRFTEDFVGQWLDLRKIDATSPDGQSYVEFDEFLFWSMPRETTAFFDEVLRNDLSLVNFANSDWGCLNERLARHYGIPGVNGGEIRKVSLPKDSHRGGVLTQGSVLKVTADGTRTSPVLRGKWVLDRIVGLPPAPPPPDIPAIEPDIRGATTIRQQLDKHRHTAFCAACHVHIDPPGFALENYDVIGGWREYYRASSSNHKGLVELANYPGRQIFRGPDVEQGGQMADGRPFKDIEQYKQFLLEDKDQLARSLTQKLIVYATGAEIQFADREVVEEIVSRLRKKNYGFRSLIHEVVQSRLFLYK